MPKTDPLITHVFEEIGMVMSGGMSQSAITFTELSNYCKMTRTDLDSWESMQVINMSREFCNWLAKGKNTECTSPWNDTSDEAIQENNDKIAEKMKSLRQNRAKK